MMLPSFLGGSAIPLWNLMLSLLRAGVSQRQLGTKGTCTVATSLLLFSEVDLQTNGLEFAMAGPLVVVGRVLIVTTASSTGW